MNNVVGIGRNGLKPDFIAVIASVCNSYGHVETKRFRSKPICIWSLAPEFNLIGRTLIG